MGFRSKDILRFARLRSPTFVSRTRAQKCYDGTPSGMGRAPSFVLFCNPENSHKTMSIDERNHRKCGRVLLGRFAAINTTVDC
jgi:hypothetical protein